MATLNINGTEFTAQCGFRFSKLADKKYSRKQQESDPDNGFNTLFAGLIEFENDHLVAFWDCALDYAPKDKPRLEEIEQALEERFKEDHGTEEAFKEAYREIDESDFFGKKVQKYWSNIELMKDFGRNEEEKEQMKMSYKRSQEARKEIEA